MKILSPDEFEKLITENPKKRFAFFEKGHNENPKGGFYWTDDIHVTDASDHNPKFGATTINRPSLTDSDILFDYDWNLDEESTFVDEFWVLEKSEITEIVNFFTSATGIDEVQDDSH